MTRCAFPRDERFRKTDEADPKSGTANKDFRVYKRKVTVVIAIIAILASMLLPALSKAREKARTISCSSSLKHMSLALSMYCDDNNDFLMDVGDTTDTWFDHLHPYSLVGTMLRCSASTKDEQWTFKHSNGTTETVGVSIGINYQFGATDTNSSGHTRGYPKMVKKLSTLRKSTGAFFDVYRKLWFLQKVDDGACAYMLKTVETAADGAFSLRHGGRGNICFTDGHVEAWTGPTLYYTFKEAYNSKPSSSNCAGVEINYWLCGQ